MGPQFQIKNDWFDRDQPLYPIFVDYKDIPAHTLNNGTTIQLRNVLDFRPAVDSNDSNFTAALINKLPDPTDVIDFDAEYYLPRLEQLYHLQ